MRACPSDSSQRRQAVLAASAYPYFLFLPFHPPDPGRSPVRRLNPDIRFRPLVLCIFRRSLMVDGDHNLVHVHLQAIRSRNLHAHLQLHKTQIHRGVGPGDPPRTQAPHSRSPIRPREPARLRQERGSYLPTTYAPDITDITEFQIRAYRSRRIVRKIRPPP